MATLWTNKGKFDLANGGVSGRQFRLLLVNTPPASAAVAADLNVVSDVTGVECVNVSGTGYARRTLANVTVTEDDSGTNDRAILGADDPAVYTAINAGTIAGGWVYRRITSGTDADSSDFLWLFVDCTDLVTNGGDVTLAFAATTRLSTIV